MDFWVAVISGGAAVLGAAVGGLAAALPAFGAEKRAADNARRLELRRSLLATLDAMEDMHAAERSGDASAKGDAASRYLRLSAEFGTLVGKDETVVTAFLNATVGLILTGHPESFTALSQASIIAPAWFRGSASVADVEQYLREMPTVAELRERDASKNAGTPPADV